MRIIGMDIHRVAAEVVALLNGQLTRVGRIPMTRAGLQAFAKKELTHDDHVVVEATGNAAAVVEILAPHVNQVVIANPKQVQLIAHARIKTDAIDAAVLAKLYVTGFLPEVWIPDGRTLMLRRQVARRQTVRRGTSLPGRITKQRRGQARGMLVEAAWAAARSPGPLRALFRRVASRRGKHIAAVATARKLAMIVWHLLTKETDYIWVRPALLARKFRSLELRAGSPTSYAKRGAAYDYNIPEKRAEEQIRVETAEQNYARFTSQWRAKPRVRKMKAQPT